MTRSSRLNRRLLLSGAMGAAGFAIVPSLRSAPPSGKVHLAAVGVGGKGWSDITSAAEGHEVLAFCDVDTQGRRRGGYRAAADRWPKAKRYTDWRKMLDEQGKLLHGVTVSTPDHMHAPVTLSAIRRGLAVYTQKPLTRTVHEARVLTRAARQAGVVTQMGNQGHSSQQYRTAVQLVQDGAIGKIREAHAWSNRPIWPQGIARPRGANTPPASLNWDLWLGVAPPRPYLNEVYHPFKWRGWYAFGAGALGDMGCHILDPILWALELGPPQSVRCDCPAPQLETFPTWERVTYRFAGNARTQGKSVRVVWHDGGKLPDAALARLPAGEALPSNGSLFVGDEGVLLTPHGGMPRLLPEEKFADFKYPEVEGANHYLQWSNAIAGKGKTTSGFEYAGPLTETVLLGVIASRVPGQDLKWNARQLRFPGSAHANAFVREAYRKGWEVEGL